MQLRRRSGAAVAVAALALLVFWGAPAAADDSPHVAVPTEVACRA